MLYGGILVVSLWFCFLGIAQSVKPWVMDLKVDNGGEWGTWGDWEYCQDGTYAVGFRMKIEHYQGSGDDSSLNGIQLICQGLNTSDDNYVTSSVGPWGSWRNATFCKHHGGLKYFLTSYILKVELFAPGRDDTAANAVQFQCRDFYSDNGGYMINDDPSIHNWGDYGTRSDGCTLYSAICGIKTKLEKNQGSGDDTALNDVEFSCCLPFYRNWNL